MHEKLNHRNRVINILIPLLITVTFITIFTSCSGSLPPKADGSSLLDPATADNPSNAAKQSEQLTENESIGQESDQSTSIQPSEEKAEPEPLKLDDDLKLGELQVDMIKETVDELIKAKLSDSKSDNSYGFESEILTYNDGTEIHLVDGKIYSISVTSSDYPTPRGLQIGDTAEKVKKLYGEPAAIEEDGLWIYSARGYDLFYVTIEDNIVVSIKVSQVM